MGWFCRRMEKRGRETFSGMCPWWFYPVMGAVMLFIFAADSDQTKKYSAYGAYYYVHTGEACNFYHEYLDRVKLLESEEPNVEVSPYAYRPWFLCIEDWSEDWTGDVNIAVANWYDKDSVTVRAE